MELRINERARRYVSYLAVAMASAGFGQAQAATTELLTVNSLQEQANSGTRSSIGFSSDGRFAVFSSSATNLAPCDTNDAPDIFIRDRLNGTTELISVDSEGAILTDGGTLHRNYNVITADGSQVLFCAYGDGSDPKLFLRDRSVGKTHLIHLDGKCGSFAMSADGNWIASRTSNLDGINLLDRQTNTTRTILPPPAPAGSTEGYAIRNIELSDDGSVLIFNYEVSGFYGEDGSYSPTIDRAYAYDVANGNLEVIKELTDLDDLSLSGDGNYVTFISRSSSLIEGFPSIPQQVVVMNRITREMDAVTLDPIGLPADSGSDYPRLNRDGSVVVFDSGAKNLTPADGSTSTNILLFDRQSRQFEVISVNNTGEPGTGGSYLPAISADGGVVGFFSVADNLVDEYTGSQRHLFARVRDVAPVDPVAVLTEFLNTLSTEELDPNLLNSLTVSIENIQASLEKDGSADEAINAFVNKVLAQQGKKVDAATAEMLIGYAQEI